VAAAALWLIIARRACSAVVSATSAIIYLQSLWPGLDLRAGTLVLLLLFALLFIWGVEESANLAGGMFALHMVTLTILLVASAVHVIANNGGHMVDNWKTSLPPVMNLEGTEKVYSATVVGGIFFGASRVALHRRMRVCVGRSRAVVYRCALVVASSCRCSAASSCCVQRARRRDSSRGRVLLADARLCVCLSVSLRCASARRCV
jgi:hypothetical protein